MSSDTLYAHDFIAKVANGVPPRDALTASIVKETELRRLFAAERDNPVLNDPYIGLVDVFSSNDAIKQIQARDVDSDAVDLDAKYVFPLKKNQRLPTGHPAIATSREQFRSAWNVFTEGALSQLTDWNNVVAAGGAVLASVLPLPDRAHGSKRAIRKYFHEDVYSTSDIDLFLYGLTASEAEKKIVQIYEAVRDSVPWDTVCVRTRHAISIHSQYPYRNVQIILRLYKSPAEILAGFDIDCACFLYDGERVWGNPRSITALMTQSNMVDMTRRSPSYEVRLAKYSLRGFEVHVPNLVRKDIDPTIFERSINRIEGLARLLVLEKLSDPENRTKYLEQRRALRGRPETQGYSRRAMRRRKKVNGDLKAEMEKFGGLNSSDYGTQSFHLPYGPGFDAKKLIKFIYSTDLGMNSTFNPKNRDRRLHRHPAFFGSITEVMEDCCEYCPEPIAEEEKELQVEEDKVYIRGRIEFMQEDPGRQLMTGSFHPIDEGEWSAQAYLGDVERLFQAVANDDIETVRDIVEGGFDLKRRDHVGRTSLQLALLGQREAIASYLIDAGARITARLVDGRTSLHLAAQYGMPNIVTKLLEKSKENEARVEAEKRAAEALAKKAKVDHDGDSEMGDTQEEEADEEELRASSEDDWDSDEDASPRKKKKGKEDKQPTSNQPPAEGEAIPEDDEELPDILDINIPDWDVLYSPLCHAIVAGHLPVVDILIHAGADVKTPFKTGPSWGLVTIYPLTLTLITEDEIAACSIAERLIEGGANCTAADENLLTVFHRAVVHNSLSIVRTFLRVDPNAKVAMDFMPKLRWQGTATPLVSAIGVSNRPMVALLIASGSKLQITEEMFDKSWETRQNNLPPNTYRQVKQPGQWLSETPFPVETALACWSDLVFPLIELGADLNLGMKSSLGVYFEGRDTPDQLLDSIRRSIANLEFTLKGYSNLMSQITPTESVPRLYEQWSDTDDSLVGWMTSQVKTCVLQREEEKKRSKENENTQTNNEISPVDILKQVVLTQLEFLREVEKLVVSHGGKTRIELYPQVREDPREMARNTQSFQLTVLPALANTETTRLLPVEYRVYRGGSYHDVVPAHLTGQYAQLFEACWKGDHATVESLCLPPKSGVPKKDATYLQVTSFIQRAVKPQDSADGISYPTAAMSTLAVAIQARQWKTAKVILAIASAQYEKADKEEPTYQYDDSDEDSECDTTMGLDEEEEEISKPVLIDLSHRLSTVKVPVGPQRLFEANRIIRGSTETLETPIDRALQDGDVTVLEHVLELGKLCEPKQELLPSHLNSALLSDSPEILDLVIRRYGYGISFDEEEDDHDESGQEGRPKVSKVYLGLNVDGKKRKDLASKADPDAPRQGHTNYVPFIWRAARMNKGKILSWLASPAPLEAYRHFMLNSTHENATSLKRIRDFDQRFPALIGSTVTDVGENVFAAYLQSGAELAIVKQIFSLFPGLKTTFVHGKLKGLETTALHQICGANLSPEIFDFFIGMGADPLAIDFKRCNIVHQLVAKNNYDLLVHVCTKLSKDQLSILFSQQSKPQMNTPLHLAVRTGRRHLVELLLAFDHPVTEVTLALRNAEGSTPLHIAVAAGFQKITSLLLDKELSASSKTLYIENGIGSTPLETAVFLRLLDISSSRFANPVVPATFDECAGYDFDMSRNWGSLPIAAYVRSSLVDRIRGRGNTNSSTPEGTQPLDQLLQSLDAEGRFKEQPEVRRVLFDYAARCHTAVPQWEAMDQSKKEFLKQEDARANNGVVASTSSMTFEKLKEIRSKLTARTYLRPNSTLLTSETTKSVQDTDTRDLEGTYKLIKSAINSSPFKQRRELVHLLDAQRAVNTALDSAIKSSDSQPTFQFGQLEDPYRWLTAKQRLNQLEKQDLDAREEAAYRFQLELGWLMIADA